MKIVHLTLTGPVTDGLSYQDNLLTKYHKRNGNDVTVITSKYVYNKVGILERINKSKYYNKDGVYMIRLNIKNNRSLNFKFKRFEKIIDTLANEKPDMLFIHGLQFLDVRKIKAYLKSNDNIISFADNHADFSNSARGFLSKFVLHKIIWKFHVNLIEPYLYKIYGVLPARVEFMNKMYKVNAKKLDILYLGADDDILKKVKMKNKDYYRQKYGIVDTDFLIVTGGKIDSAKLQLIDFLKAINILKKSKIKVLVFGSVQDDIFFEFSKLLNDNVRYIGWLSNIEAYEVFNASNLVVFPGRHSVYWEQVVALGIPMFVKFWKGSTHIDIGSNCKFFYKDSIDEYMEMINSITNNQSNYLEMLKGAISLKKEEFNYSQIALKNLEDYNKAQER